MLIEDAIKVIRDSGSSFTDSVKAAGVLADSKDTPLAYLLECLKRTGLPAEIAAMKLYKRTKRPGPVSPKEFISNYENWSTYLQQAGLLQ